MPGVPDGVGGAGDQRHLRARRRPGRRASPRPARRPRRDRRRRPAAARRARGCRRCRARRPARSPRGRTDRATHRACSRAPEPITSTRTGRTLPSAGAQRQRRLGWSRSAGGRRAAGPAPAARARASTRSSCRCASACSLRQAVKPGRVEPAVVDGRGDRAAGLGAVRAVAEPALGGQLGDVGVGGVDALGVVVEAELPHAGGVDEQPAAGQQVQLAGGGGVPAAAVVARISAGRGERSARPARWPGWTCPTPGRARPSPRSGPARAARATASSPSPVTELTGEHLDAEGVLGHLAPRPRRRRRTGRPW